MKKKKYRFAEDIVKNPQVLNSMDLDSITKKKLQKEAGKWLRYIKLHSKDMKHPFNNQYHVGEMSFIEFFFFYKSKKKNKVER